MSAISAETPPLPEKDGTKVYLPAPTVSFFISAIAWATFGTICIKVGFTYFYFWRILEKRALTVHESNVSEQKGCVTAVALWICPGNTMKRTEAITLIVRARGGTSERLVCRSCW